MYFLAELPVIEMPHRAQALWSLGARWKRALLTLSRWSNYTPVAGRCRPHYDPRDLNGYPARGARALCAPQLDPSSRACGGKRALSSLHLLAEYKGYTICSSAVFFTPFAFILVCLHGDLWMHFKRRYQWLMRSAGALGSTPAALPPALEGIIAHLCLMHIIPQDAWPKELLQVLGRGAARLKIPH